MQSSILNTLTPYITSEFETHSLLTTIYVVAEGMVGSLYAAAIEQAGGTSRIIDSHAAFVAGILALGACA